MPHKNSDTERFYVSLSNGRLSAYAFPSGTTLAKGASSTAPKTVVAEKGTTRYNQGTDANVGDGHPSPLVVANKL